MCLNYIVCQTIFLTFQFILYFIKQTYLAKKKEEKGIRLKPLGTTENAPSGGRRVYILQKTVISLLTEQ